MLGQGALTSPGHFTNAAQPIARATARNRAIAQTRAPSSAVRSRPDHHPLDIRTADLERTAHTTGCELLDVLRYDHHSGPRRKRPQLCITKNRILASDADATIAWTVSRFPRNLREAAEEPELLHSCQARERAFCHRFFPGAADCQPPSPDAELASPLPNHRQGHAGGSPPAASAKRLTAAPGPTVSVQDSRAANSSPRHRILRDTRRRSLGRDDRCSHQRGLPSALDCSHAGGRRERYSLTPIGVTAGW